MTHWIFTLAFFGLVVSGVAILLAHPRFYWGETGGYGAASLFDLPLPLVLTGQTGWGRSLHFLCAWMAVLAGLVYAVSVVVTGHFGRQLLPAPTRPRAAEEGAYNVLQQLTYLAVVFVVFPMAILTGLAMSPAIASVVPQAVTVWGGQQSARTVHFFVADLLVLFLLVHLAMVIRAGFSSRMRAMITGRIASKEPR